MLSLQSTGRTPAQNPPSHSPSSTATSSTKPGYLVLIFMRALNWMAPGLIWFHFALSVEITWMTPDASFASNDIELRPAFSANTGVAVSADGAERQDGRRVAVCLNAYRHWFTPDCLVLQELGRRSRAIWFTVGDRQEKENPAGGPAGLSFVGTLRSLLGRSVLDDPLLDDRTCRPGGARHRTGWPGGTRHDRIGRPGARDDRIGWPGARHHRIGWLVEAPQDLARDDPAWLERQPRPHPCGLAAVRIFADRADRAALWIDNDHRDASAVLQPRALRALDCRLAALAALPAWCRAGRCSVRSRS